MHLYGDGRGDCGGIRHGGKDLVMLQGLLVPVVPALVFMGKIW